MRIRYLPSFGAAALVGAAALSSVSHADTLRVGGAGAALGTMRLLATEFEKASPGDKIVAVPNLGSSGGLKALNAGALDLAAVARELRPEEVAQGLVPIEYGRTPFVFAMSKIGTGPVLSAASVTDMYAGRLTAWPSGTPVRLVLRPLQDSDTQAIGEMSGEIKAALPTIIAKPGMIVAPTDQDAADTMENIPGALGTLTLALIVTEKRKVHMVPINGVVPSVNALGSGTYPYEKTMYLVRKGTFQPVVARFMQFLATPRGRQLITDAGHLAPAAARGSK